LAALLTVPRGTGSTVDTPPDEATRDVTVAR
jgi:hypothetical protein